MKPQFLRIKKFRKTIFLSTVTKFLKESKLLGLQKRPKMAVMFGEAILSWTEKTFHTYLNLYKRKEIRMTNALQL
jgi:hypothetical protein